MNKKQMKKELKRIQDVEQELNVRIDNLENDVLEKEQEIVELKDETKDIRKVQEQQGLDITALAKAINSLEDKKIVFEDEYAKNEDKYNRLMKMIEENPDMEHELKLGLGSCQRGMKNAAKSQKVIDEKITGMTKFMKEFLKFCEYNYQNI